MNICPLSLPLQRVHVILRSNSPTTYLNMNLGKEASTAEEANL